MTEIIFDVSALPLHVSPIPLGVRAENDVTQVKLRFDAWAQEYGAGVVQLLVLRSGDTAPYPVLLAQSGTEATWTVFSTDLAFPGELRAEYVYTVGTAIKKSAVLRFFVARDIGAPGAAPDPYEDWLEHLTELAAETQQAAIDAEAASEAVQDMGVEAEALEPGETPTVTKSVDPETGAVTLVFGLPSGGAVESVNGKTGDVTLDAEDVGALPDTATLDDISDGSTYKRATAAQVAQIGANETAITGLVSTVTGIEAKIPAAASSVNQLADKKYVTDSITQQTAIYRGSYATKTALLAVAWQTTDPNAAYYVSNNDYAVVLADESQDGGCWRYIYSTGTGWLSQYEINESPMTQAQLDALNSGATAAIISSVDDKLDKTGDAADTTVTFTQAEQRTAIATGEKLSVIVGKISKWLADLGTAAWRNVTTLVAFGNSNLVTSGAVYTAVSAKYTKPATGIPKSDLKDAVQASLGKADTALQSVPSTYRTAADQDLIDAAQDAAIDENRVQETLLFALIPGTTQTVIFSQDGKPQSVTHAADGTAVRADAFVWGSGTVTETRTLASGERLTITTDLTTLETVISGIEEAT